MGKRSDYPRRERDFYPTPESAVLPLLDELRPETVFDEPCCGDGSLVRALESHSDAMCFITNPPWSRPILHDMILHLSKLRPTWLLIDAGWMHTKQSIQFMDYCLKIVSIGRVKWIEGSKHTGKDDCVWMHFDHRYKTLSHPIMFKARSL